MEKTPAYDGPDTLSEGLYTITLHYDMSPADLMGNALFLASPLSYNNPMQQNEMLQDQIINGIDDAIRAFRQELNDSSSIESSSVYLMDSQVHFQRKVFESSDLANKIDIDVPYAITFDIRVDNNPIGAWILILMILAVMSIIPHPYKVTAEGKKESMLGGLIDDLTQPLADVGKGTKDIIEYVIIGSVVLGLGYVFLKSRG